MKKINKNFLSLLLVLTLMISGTGSIFASAISVENIQSKQIAELTEEKAQILDNVMAQLEEQGREDHYFIYKEIVEAQYQEKLNRIKGYSTTAAAETRYNAPNGGAMSYNRAGAKVTEIYFNKAQTDKLRDQQTQISAGNVLTFIGNIVAYIKQIPSAYTLAIDALILANSYKNSMSWNAINNGNRCAFSVSAVYEMETSSVFYVWSGFPYMTLPSGVTDVTVKY